jgi:hypothetical protein
MAEAGATILRCEQAEQAIESVTIGVPQRRLLTAKAVGYVEGRA